MAEEYLFVYGTLRREANSDQLLVSSAEFVGEAFFRGRLYRIDWYPGAIPSKDPKDLVRGEVYRLIQPESLLPRLDEYEGCNHKVPETSEFVRRKLSVFLQNRAQIEAWIYVYARPTDGLARITSGDFLRPQV